MTENVKKEIIDAMLKLQVRAGIVIAHVSKNRVDAVIMDTLQHTQKDLNLLIKWVKEENKKSMEKKVCTASGVGEFCTFECEYCDAFKEPEERKEQNDG